MKEKALINLFFILLIPSIFALGFEVKSGFQEGETFFAKISGTFIEPIAKEDISFYRGHVETTFVYDLMKINGAYYIYAQLAEKQPENYSILIEGVKYQHINQIIEEYLVANFTIIGGRADFTINPGFVSTKNSFYLTIQNIQDSQIEVSREFGQVEEGESNFFESLFGSGTVSENTLSLFSGEIRDLFFEVEPENYSYFDFVTLSSENTQYEIPIYIFGKDLKPKEKAFEFRPGEMDNITLATGSETRRIFYLENTGEEKIENISLTVSDRLKPFITIFPENISELEFNSSKKITLLIKSENISFEYSGQLTAKHEGLYAYASLFLYFVDDYVPLNDFTDTNDSQDGSSATSKTCAEINGTFCGEEEICSGKTMYPRDGICCVGTCGEEKKGSTGSIIGWILIIIIAGFLVWFFISKYKKAK